MECSEVCQRLDAYLARVLTDEEAQAVERHISQCEDCRSELTAAQELALALEDPLLQDLVLNDPTPLPAGFTDQVMAQVLAEHPTGVNLVLPWLRRRWSGRQYMSLAYAMSATMVVVSAGKMLFLWNETTNRLAIWGVQGQAYWEAAQAYLTGTGGYLVSTLSGWVTALFQIG